ncbi:ribosome assembly cofactor RimP [Flavobacteriaceae bacterium]|nr:ribosome assembly cofactor RimP [Flavobacteriaceae bacterium]
MNFKKTVAELLQIALNKNPSLFLIDLKIGADNSIVVLLDGDEGVTLESCVAVSRQIEHNIDREEHDFSLEVSSVGIGSELTIPRQYIKNKGRKLEVISLDDKIFKGNLTQADQESITLKWKTREPKPIGKGKVTVTKTKKLTFASIKKAKVVINN